MILVTGGTGYIGSHACVALAQAGHELLILDNLCNSRAGVVDRLQSLCGKRPGFVEGDIRDTTLLDNLFARHPISAVMHFAGLKAVGESVQKPLEYYDNNVHGRRKTCWRRLSGLTRTPRLRERLHPLTQCTEVARPPLSAYGERIAVRGMQLKQNFLEHSSHNTAH